MKRRISLMLITTLIATAFVACNKNKEPEQVQEEQSAVVEDIENTEENVSTSNPEYAYTSVKYDDDYEYFYGKIQCVELTDSDHKALSEAINSYFSEQVVAFNKTCENMVAEAKKANSELGKEKVDNEGTENEYVYDYTSYFDYEVTVEVTRCDNQMFSMHLQEYTYQGGANGSTLDFGVTFDTQTGEILENTSFESCVGDIATAIRNQIENSPAEAKANLFDDYDDYIARMEDGILSSVAVWFNERGIVIGFPEDTMAPHAAGCLEFNIPYSNLTGFDEKYIPTEEYYCVKLSDQGFVDTIDVDGDGNAEQVYLEIKTDDETYETSLKVHVGDKEIVLDDSDVFTYDCRFVHSTTGNYFIIQTSGSSDWCTLNLYDVSKNLKKVQGINGWIESISDGTIEVGYIADAFGTWSCKREYTYDGNGFSSSSTVDNLDNDPRTNADARGLTLKKNLTYTDSEGETQKLKKGETIYPVELDGDKLKFVNADGSVSGYFTFEFKDYERYVDGVSEYEMFDNIMYAG